MTGKPNYAGGTVSEGYTEGGLQVGAFAEEVEVLRVPVRSNRTGGARNFFLNFLSFVRSGLRHFRKLAKGPALVVTAFVSTVIGTLAFCALAMKKGNVATPNFRNLHAGPPQCGHRGQAHKRVFPNA